MKKIKTVLSLLLAFLFALAADAQNLSFSIDYFGPDETDMTAREMNRNDGDGHAYSIIKVTSDIEDDDLSKFDFNFAYMKFEKEIHDNELWIYIQRGAKIMDIRREGYKSITKFEIKPAIKEGITYTLRLRVQPVKVTHRVLEFKVHPANENAIVKVKPEGDAGNYQLWGPVDVAGSINRLLESGVYLYEVSADNYLTSQGRVVLTPSNDGDNFVEDVRLTPNFGFLEIDDSHGIAGAEVYINDRKVGTVPFRSKRMECRDDYRLMISNGDLYKTYNATFSIVRGETTKLSPRLESNFAETTIKVAGDAEILINNVSKGHGTWKGPLRAGSYNIECRLPNHKSSTRQIVVRPDFAETFIIDTPTPIVGSLYVTTNPSGAKIYVDGEDAGYVTPRQINNVLIGHHKVILMLPNHRTETREVTIREGETTKIDAVLSNIITMRIESNPDGARLSINNKFVGYTPHEEELASGTYKIQIEKIHHRTQNKTVRLDGSHSVQKFTLHRQFQLRNQFYIQPMYQTGEYTSGGAAIGFFANNFNVEGDFLYGLDTETIYWNFIGGEYTSYRYAPEKDVLTSMYAGGKIGYGIIAGTRLRFTPQLGGGYLMIMGDQSSSYAINATLGLRLDCALFHHFSLVAAPEYGFSVVESDTFKSIANISSKLKGWNNGFNLRVGISCYF